MSIESVISANHEVIEIIDADPVISADREIIEIIDADPVESAAINRVAPIEASQAVVLLQPHFSVVGVQNPGDSYGPIAQMVWVRDTPNPNPPGGQYIARKTSYIAYSRTLSVSRGMSLEEYIVHDPVGGAHDLVNTLFVDVTNLSEAARDPCCAVYKEPALVWDGIVLDLFERAGELPTKSGVLDRAGDLMKRLPIDDQIKLCEHLLHEENNPKYAEIPRADVHKDLIMFAADELLRICKRGRFA